jgi:hypothetical protein
MMGQKKKAYRRFEELTKRAMAPGSAEAEPDRAATDPQPGAEGAGSGSAPAEELPVWLSPAVHRALLLRAAADNTTASAIVEESLRRYLEMPRSRFS